MKNLPLIAAFACAVAGCGGAEAPANKATGEEDFQARILAMPEGQRNGVFVRAIRDARQTCQRVDSSAPAASVRGRPVWTAVCQGGESYTLVILPGGNVQVLNDAESRLVPDNAVAPQRR
jgi:hypothetical protein